MTWDPNLVHRVDGIVDCPGVLFKAVCACGASTTRRMSERRAVDVLTVEHGLTPPVCAVCGRDYTGEGWQQIRDAMDILTDDVTGKQFLACKGSPLACRDAAAQRQLHLDTAAFNALGIDTPLRRRLRIVKNI